MELDKTFRITYFAKKHGKTLQEMQNGQINVKSLFRKKVLRVWCILI